MANKVVITEAKITIGGTAYDCKSIPSGLPETCEPPDVTVLTDVEQRFEEAAYTEDNEFQVVIAGDPPAVNTVGTTQLTLKASTAGGTPSAANVSCGNCIVTKVEPATLEAGGDRVLTWTLTIRPDGSR